MQNPLCDRAAVRFSEPAESPVLSASQFAQIGVERQTALNLLGTKEQRAASFVRVHNLLLRTHVASLAAALADDGWLQQPERECLCAQAREGSATWTLAFLRAYSHFAELKDVDAFVHELRTLPCT